MFTKFSFKNDFVLQKMDQTEGNVTYVDMI